MSPAFRSRKDGSHYPISRRKHLSTNTGSKTREGWEKRRFSLSSLEPIDNYRDRSLVYDASDGNTYKLEFHAWQVGSEPKAALILQNLGKDPPSVANFEFNKDYDTVEDYVEGQMNKIDHQFEKGHSSRQDNKVIMYYNHSSECSGGECPYWLAVSGVK